MKNIKYRFIKDKRALVQIGLGVVLLFFAFTILCIAHKNKNVERVEESTSKVSEAISPANIGIQRENTFLETTVPMTESVTEETTTFYQEVVTQKKEDTRRIDLNTKYPFIIKVNRAENFASIYALDEKGKYTIPYKVFVCSTGSNPEYTPLGTFEISDKYRWHLMVDNSYAQYAIRIFNHIMLHSIPYKKPSPDSLEYKEYNKLGKAASLGCVRFQAADIRWIYKHCPEGTKVEIYSRKNEVPELELPTIKKIKKTNKKKGWDPTDSDKRNPWR